MRELNAVLLEAQLVNSSPEYVYEWLRSHAEGQKAVDDLDEEAEKALLMRQQPLVDLGLARYGGSQEVLRRLFRESTASSSSDAESSFHSERGLWIHGKSSATSAARLAVLTNQIVNRAHFVAWGGSRDTLPVFLFNNDEELQAFLANATNLELAALLRNPNIDDDFLASLFDHAKWFANLEESRWRLLIAACTRNPRLSAKEQTTEDGSGDYFFNHVFAAAWRLCAKVPVTVEWAAVLSALLTATTAAGWSFKQADIPSVIERWRVPEEACGESRRFRGLPKYGILNEFENVRLQLARLFRPPRLELLRTDDDIALRCAFYANGCMSADQIAAAFDKDREYFLAAALRNERIWRSADSREALTDQFQKSSNEGGSLEYWPQEEMMRSEHPDWFKDDN
jgi:hypothetical protein